MKVESGFPPRPVLIATFVRTAVLVGVNVTAQVLTALSEADLGIGAGIALFAVTMAISVAWGTIDGIRRPFVVAAVPWLPTAVLAAFLSIVCVSVAETISFGEPLGSALTNLGLYVDLLPFLFGLVLVPAVLGVLLGLLFRHLRGQPDDRTTRPSGKPRRRG